MRISDWSSDVCSSDLPTAQRWRVSWPEINEETPQCCPDGRNRLVIGGGLWRHAGACSARLRQSPKSVPTDEAEGRGDNRWPMAAHVFRGSVCGCQCQEESCVGKEVVGRRRAGRSVNK